MALAALLRFSGLGAQSFWSDEAITVQLVHMDRSTWSAGWRTARARRRCTAVQPVQLAGRTDIDGPMVLLAPR